MKITIEYKPKVESVKDMLDFFSFLLAIDVKGQKTREQVIEVKWSTEDERGYEDDHVFTFYQIDFHSEFDNGFSSYPTCESAIEELMKIYIYDPT